MEHRNSNHYIPNNQISIEKYTGTSHQRILAKLTQLNTKTLKHFGLNKINKDKRMKKNNYNVMFTQSHKPLKSGNQFMNNSIGSLPADSLSQMGRKSHKSHISQAIDDCVNQNSYDLPKFQSITRENVTNHRRHKDPQLAQGMTANSSRIQPKQENLKQKQIKYLSNIFKACVQKYYKQPRSSSFDQMTGIYNSINLNEWMLLCKNIKLFQFFNNSRDIVRTISAIFKKLQNKQNRLNFDQFCLAFGSVMQTMENYAKDKQIQINGQQIRMRLGLCSFQNNLKVLQSIEQNINYKSSGYLPKLLQVSTNSPSKIKTNQHSHSRSHHGNSSIKNSRFTISQNKRLKKSQSNLESEQTKKEKQKSRIYYRRQERIRSRIMRNLLVSNLHKLVPSDRDKQNLDAIVLGDDDYYLKQYLKKKKQITDGIAKKLQKKTLYPHKKSKKQDQSYCSYYF